MNKEVVDILQISDTHLFADQKKTLLGVPTYESLAAVVRHIADKNDNIDFLVHTGDISQDVSEDSYRLADSLLSTLKVPVYTIPGNHDNPVTMEDIYPLRCIQKQRFILTQYWQFILLDTHKEGKVSGYLSEDELDYLHASLQKHTSHHAAIIFHHHPIPTGSAWLDKLGLMHPEIFWDIVARHSQVKAIIFGHVHQAISKTCQGIPCYSSPSTSIQFKPDMQNFHLDDVPQGYRLLRFFPDGHVETSVERLPHYVGIYEKHARGY